MCVKNTKNLVKKFLGSKIIRPSIPVAPMKIIFEIGSYRI